MVGLSERLVLGSVTSRGLITSKTVQINGWRTLSSQTDDDEKNPHSSNGPDNLCFSNGAGHIYHSTPGRRIES